MSQYVMETAAAKALSAYVVMKGRRHVATVRAFHGARCLVNVHQDQDGIERCRKKSKGVWMANEYGFQWSSASGYGYDRLTAALGGLWIDGHRLADHGTPGKIPPKGSTVFPAEYIPPKGYRVTNWSSELGGFLSCYRLPGLEYLRDIGYTVVQVL